MRNQRQTNHLNVKRKNYTDEAVWMFVDFDENSCSHSSQYDPEPLLLHTQYLPTVLPSPLLLAFFCKTRISCW